MHFKDFVYVVFNKDYYPKRHKLLGHLNNMCFDIIKILLVSLNDDLVHCKKHIGGYKRRMYPLIIIPRKVFKSFLGLKNMHYCNIKYILMQENFLKITNESCFLK